MRITDLNREGGIGSNALLIELGAFNFIVDSGLHPKLAGIEAMPDFSPTEDKTIHFVIITHCHLDHIGSLPVLLKKHPDARVFMSHASHMLIARMLHNSCNVMKRQKKEQNIKEYPLFTHDEIDYISDRFEVLPYNKRLNLYEGSDELEIVLHAAGHVAGAGGFEIEHSGRNFFFTGDVLFDDQRILPGANFPIEKTFETIVMETTRGETERPEGKTREQEVNRLLATIRHTIERGGSVLIPVFALGRMQETLTIINDAIKSSRLPASRIFGAGLGLDLADYLDQIAKRVGQVKFTRKVIKELRLKRPPRKLTPGREPPEQGIYILSSGMMVEHTPSYAMAASLLSQQRNTICFVGYCDPDTPGGKLLETGPGENFVFEAYDYQTPARAQIERFELSGHADREELLEFALSAKPRNVVLTHGDPGARAWFQKALSGANKDLNVVDPQPLKALQV